MTKSSPLFIRNLFLTCLLIISGKVHASLDLGVGMSSTTSGRLVPALAGGLYTGGWAITGSANGVQSGYYYHSIYTLNYYRTWSSGNLLGGDVNSGVGGGVTYSMRGYEDDNADLKEAADLFLGPAFFVRWDFGDTVYLNTEMIWGLRDFIQHVALNAQDVIVFSLGVQLW